MKTLLKIFIEKNKREFFVDKIMFSYFAYVLPTREMKKQIVLRLQSDDAFKASQLNPFSGDKKGLSSKLSRDFGACKSS